MQKSSCLGIKWGKGTKWKGGQSLGLEQGIIFQETDRLDDVFKLGKPNIAPQKNEIEKFKFTCNSV